MVNLLFFDTSALLKRYVHEQGSQWVQTVTSLKSSPIVFVSRITWIEVQSAFARLAREHSIDAGKLAATRQLFEYDWTNQFQIVELDKDIATHAGQLVQQYGVLSGRKWKGLRKTYLKYSASGPTRIFIRICWK